LEGYAISKRLAGVDWPDGTDFGVCLTHDVDRITKTRFHSAYYFLKDRKLSHIHHSHWDKDPYWNIDTIMQLEAEHGIRSTFFFLNEQDLFKDRPARSLFKPMEWKLYYSSYRLTDPMVKDTIRQLDKQSWEIALHGSYMSCDHKDLLCKEKEILESVLGKRIIGVRQHYLRLEVPTTWLYQRELGFKYDSSFGAPGLVEAHENWIRPFRPIGEDFLVIPVTIMDGYLFRECRSMALAWQKCLMLLEWARKNHGLVTLVWHSQYFNKQEFPGWSRIYDRLIQEAQKMNAWMGTAKEVYEIYSAHATADVPKVQPK
jgi:peptidoglycan/xylan/chitin deacetylase (PgdA/CDA1 family)